MSEFKPFADNKAVWTLPSIDGGEFTVENGTKKITASGDIVITKDAAGIETTEELITFLQGVLTHLRSE